MRRNGNKVFDTIETAIKGIEEYISNNGEITAIEFSLVSDTFKLQYLDKFMTKKYSNNDGTCPMWLFSWCSDEKKIEMVNFYIDKRWRFTKDMISICPEELIEKYIDYRIKDGDLYTFETEFLNDRQIAEYTVNRVNRGDYITLKEFDKLTEKYKLLYLLRHGVNNLEEEIQDWFNTWKKAKGRDVQIDKILLD